MKKLLPIIAVAILCTSVILKSKRYLHVTQPHDDVSIEHNLSNFMAHYNWVKSTKPTAHDQSLLKSLTFRKPTCQSAVTIVFLNDNRELRYFIKNTLGNDYSIFENQQFSTDQDAMKIGVFEAALEASVIFGQSGKHTLPPLAISPAPTGKFKPCAPPTQRHWISWFKNTDIAGRHGSPKSAFH